MTSDMSEALAQMEESGKPSKQACLEGPDPSSADEGFEISLVRRMNEDKTAVIRRHFTPEARLAAYRGDCPISEHKFFDTLHTATGKGIQSLIEKDWITLKLLSNRVVSQRSLL